MLSKRSILMDSIRMKAPTATQQKPPHRSDREEDEALDIVDLLIELNASH
jgi:hypothetical protein